MKILNIIMVNYNSINDTQECVKSIVESIDSDLHINIYIYDNSEDKQERDSIYNYVNNFSEESVTIFLEQGTKNIGFAAANNYWLKKLELGSIVWFLNNDTIINKNLIKTIYSTNIDNKKVYHFDCHDISDSYHDTGLHYINMITGRYHDAKTSKNDFPYICGASFIVKKTEALPNWTEDYFLYFEDVDYSKILLQNGYEFQYLPDCYFLHKISSSTGKKSNINTIKLRSQILFMKKYSKYFSVFVVGKFFYILLRKPKYLINFLELLNG